MNIIYKASQPKLYNIIIIITLYYNILAAVVSHPIGHSLVVP